MQLEDKVFFALSTVRPMAEYTLPYLASVIGARTVDQGEHVGSALRCTLDGRRAIVTAWHVIDRAMRYPHIAISAGYGMPPHLVDGEIHYMAEEDADLAVYFLPEEYPSLGERLRFWPQERIDYTRKYLSTDYLFVHGFPCVQSRFSHEASGVVSKSLPYGVMRRLENIPIDLASSQFAVDFDPLQIHVENGETEGLPDPHGLSGSPVWRIGASSRSAKDWTTDWSRLVGIVTQWREDSKILVATDASKIVDLLNKSNPS